MPDRQLEVSLCRHEIHGDVGLEPEEVQSAQLQVEGGVIVAEVLRRQRHEEGPLGLGCLALCQEAAPLPEGLHASCLCGSLQNALDPRECPQQR